ncbi:hypothetical protein [Burkholderia gladioli]|uniref:hypothetical protein n=1 Tax=Burkholderia gladioli TaxID=28095 RepID=UPI0005C6359B|nr:hypothetical protein [Burkholderia gladioli]MBW5288097.1 hypothetical protein [Burkholderia gladioli]
MNENEKTLAESALTFATFAAFALPEPGGFVVAGLLATLNGVVSACAGGEGQGDQFLSTLSSTFQKDLEHNDINLAVSAFSAYAVWLKEYHADLTIPSKLQPGADALGYAEFMNFYGNLQKAVTDPGQPLRNWLQVLMRDDPVEQGASFSTRSLCALLYGAGVFAALSKIYISINSTAFQRTDTAAVKAFCADLERFVRHADALFRYIEGQRTQRMSAISEVHSTTAVLAGSGYNPTTGVWEIQDRDEYYPRPEPSFDRDGSFWGGSYMPTSIPAGTVYAHQTLEQARSADRDAAAAHARAFHTQYVEQAEGMFERYFFGENRHTMEQTLSGLKRSLDNARAQLPAG